MTKEGYRADLDGLRAIAVLAVIFYHAELKIGSYSFLPGGFLGVDVFFVLSGFLITWILFEKDINISNFFKSRFDRIYPALLLVIFLCCLISYFLLLPSDLASLAESARSALFFFSNYYFMAEDAYVADSAKFKALLHTWSLSLEWQFYLIYPFIIIGIKKFFKQHLLACILFLCFLSFIYCNYLMRINLSDAFYSSPSRVWELFFGGLAYAVTRHIGSDQKYGYVSLFGLVIVVFSFFYFDDSMNHPGFISLLVVIGASLVIVFNVQNEKLYNIFSFKYFAFIGLVSYSLYLLHQPIFVFFRFEEGDIDWGGFFILFFITFILSCVQYFFYENPMRKSKRSWKYALMLALLLLTLAFINGALNTEGFPRRISNAIASEINQYNQPEYRKLHSDVLGRNMAGTKQSLCINRDPVDACVFGEGESYVSVGDSFAGVFDASLVNAHPDKRILVLSYEQCPLLLDAIWLADAPECWEVNKKRWEVIEKLPASKILIGTNFQLFSMAKRSYENYSLSGTNDNSKLADDLVYTSLKNSVERLRGLGHQPIIMNQPPQPSVDVYKESQRMIRKGIGFENSYGALPEEAINNKLKELFKGDYTIVDFDSIFCDQAKGCLNFDEEGGLYNRGNHLSEHGVQKTLKYIKKNNIL